MTINDIVAEGTIASWRDLLVWQKAHAAVVGVYRLTRDFPADERYRLTDQLCRAGASVPTNIAEGKGLSRRVSPISHYRARLD